MAVLRRSLEGAPGWNGAIEHKKSPRGIPGACCKCLAETYFRTGRPRTIIGVPCFHFRVRNGIGWFPRALATRQTSITDSGCRYELRVLGALRAGAAVAWVLYDQAARSISTGRLHVLPRVDRRPINVVIFDGPSGGVCPREALSWEGLPA